jgi:predicted phosphodiesterase
MKLAIFSDVHGNRFALEAVLHDIEAHKPDALANLGDQVWGAADPAGAWALQQTLGATTVRGNTDEFVASDLSTLSEGPRAWARWLREELPPSVPNVLGQLPLTEALAEGEVVIAHGALHDSWAALLFDMTSDTVEPAPEAQLADASKRFPKARVFVVGHTHRELLRSSRGVTFINSGPVSRYLDGYGVARWLLLERRDEHWNAQFRRVSYDVDQALNWAKRHSPFADEEARLLKPQD